MSYDITPDGRPIATKLPKQPRAYQVIVEDGIVRGFSVDSIVVDVVGLVTEGIHPVTMASTELLRANEQMAQAMRSEIWTAYGIPPPPPANVVEP